MKFGFRLYQKKNAHDSYFTQLQYSKAHLTQFQLSKVSNPSFNHELIPIWKGQDSPNCNTQSWLQYEINNDILLANVTNLKFEIDVRYQYSSTNQQSSIFNVPAPEYFPEEKEEYQLESIEFL